MKAQNIISEFSQVLKFQGGDPCVDILSPDHPKTKKPATLVYVSKTKDLESALNSSAVCCICEYKLIETARDHFTTKGRCLLSSSNVNLAMALVNMKFFSFRDNKTAFGKDLIHPSAIIHPTADIALSAVIGPNTTIGANCKIDENTVIGANVTIEEAVVIGKDCHIHPQVYIAHHCILGDRCEVHPQTSIGTEGYGYAHDKQWNHYRIPHLGRSVLEDDVHIGAGVSIDRGTYEDSVIKRGTKIDNHCHLAHNHSIGKNSLITAGFIVAGSTTIGKNYVAGGRTSVNGHINITDNVQTAGMSAVTKDINTPGTYAGYPLMKHKEHLRAQAIIGKLPEMKKLLSAIIKKIDL